MSQEQFDKDPKRPLPRFNNRPTGDDNNTPRKGPKFSIYWIYAIIFAVLIGFQFFGPFTPNMTQIDQHEFTQMLKSGDVDKYIVVSNRNVVRVFLKKESLPKYQDQLKKGFGGSKNEDGPQMYFKIVSGDSFQDDMRKFYSDNPGVQNVGKVDTERDWFSPILNLLLPVLLFIALWVLLMRKMGGGAGGGGGPGGIFNIGKSKATLFDKGTKVNITFADVAGLDEAKVEVMEIVDFLKTPKNTLPLVVKFQKVLC